MQLRDESIQEIVKFFEAVLQNYRNEIEKRFFEQRFKFTMYFGYTIYIFTEANLIMKKSYYTHFPETFEEVKYRFGMDRENLELFLLENVKKDN